ncbi:MAG: GIY-YIG nuclease family protein [Candidatus Marinimicrobia bacterium]|nr:GIY-YIG nuclease family protein [Candidatus Neomarinimicrobiota bacterium]
MFKVYVLKSLKDNYHYIGHTANLEKRLKEHNKGKVRSTKPHRPFKIIYTESYHNRSSAFKREMYLKSFVGNIWLRKKLKNLKIKLPHFKSSIIFHLG